MADFNSFKPGGAKQIRSARKSRTNVNFNDGHGGALLLFGIGVLLVGVALLREGLTSSAKDPIAAEIARSSYATDANFQRRMEAHILATETAQFGARVEMEKSLKAEQELYAHAPAQPVNENADLPEAVVQGVRLAPEPYHLTSGKLDQLRGQDAPVSYSIEADIRNQVERDREATLWEIRARKEFVAQFIKNARRDGWIAKVDKDYNVVYTRATDFEESRSSGRRPQSTNVAQDLRPEEVPKKIKVPLFANYCPQLF